MACQKQVDDKLLAGRDIARLTARCLRRRCVNLLMWLATPFFFFCPVYKNRSISYSAAACDAICPYFLWLFCYSLSILGPIEGEYVANSSSGSSMDESVFALPKVQVSTTAVKLVSGDALKIFKMLVQTFLKFCAAIAERSVQDSRKKPPRLFFL
jgi:hypothetical protein